MFDDGGMPACYNIIITKPSNTFTHIFDVFACDCDNQVPCRNLLQCCCEFGGYIRQGFICKSPVFRVNLPVVYTADTAVNEIFLLQTIAANNLGNLSQLPILHPIGTQFLYHLTQPTHRAIPSSPSISAMIFSISSRRTASCATISRIWAFSCPISMISRVSSGST